MNTETELQTKLTPEAKNVLALAGNLSPQERLELTSNMLSDLAYAMEPKDRLTLAAALVKQAVQRLGPKELAEMERSVSRLMGFLWKLCRTEARLGGYPSTNRDMYAVKDSITLRSRKLDVMLVSMRADNYPTNVEWMQAAWAVGYRVATREENIAYATRLLDKQKEMEADMALHEISKLQNKISLLRGVKSPADGYTNDTSNWPNSYEKEAFCIYLDKSEGWVPVRDIEGMVTIKADNGYEILARDCSIISYGRGPDLFPDRKVSADTSRAMLLVRESEKQEE